VRRVGMILLLLISSFTLLQALSAASLQMEASKQSATCQKMMRYLQDEKEALATPESRQEFQRLVMRLEQHTATMLKEAKREDERALVKFIAHCLAQMQSFRNIGRSTELKKQLIHTIEETDQLLMASGH